MEVQTIHQTNTARHERVKLVIVPCELDEANAFVRQYHRHHRPVVGHKFSIAVSAEEKVVGVAIIGRPVSRMLDDTWTLEVNRVATGRNKERLLRTVRRRMESGTSYGISASRHLHPE